MNIKKTQYNSVNVKLSTSQRNESITNNATKVILKLSSNMIGNSNYEANFTSDLSANIRLSKTQLSETMQSREFLGRLRGSLLNTVHHL